MRAFKGFNKDLTCRGFQYKEGETYKEDKAVLCKTGFHACESPVECLRYYWPATSVYHEVELMEVSKRTDYDTKRVGKKITIRKKLGIYDICHLTYEYVKSHCTHIEVKGEEGGATAGEYGAANAGYGGAAAVGRNGAATAGDRGKASAGHYGAAKAGTAGAATAGDCGAALAGAYGVATAGEFGVATAGYCGIATAGNSGAAKAGVYGVATAGNYGAATASDNGVATAGRHGAATAGDNAVAASRGLSETGKNGLAVTRGSNARVRGGLGSLLVIAEEIPESSEIKGYATAIVDGMHIKADTWYKLEDGRLVEADDTFNDD